MLTLIGILIVIIGFAMRFNPLIVVVVAGIATDVIDKGAYGTFRVFIDIYAKDLANGRKDAGTLSTLTDKVFDILPISSYPFYCDIYSTFAVDDGAGYHINKIYLDCIVTQTT